MQKIRAGGVPEHFNYPWKYALEKGYFEKAGIELIWNNYPGGTGAMATALKNNELDLALLLTEGAIKEITSGAHFKIIAPFVESPLIWGIHTGASRITIENIRDKKFAISRLGSGSHLMAYVYTEKHNLSLSQDQLVIVGDLAGARQALSTGQADLFMWEKFMTKPLVDSGEFTLIDEMPTPWPCFMLAGTESFTSGNSQLTDQVLSVLKKSITELTEKNDLAGIISERYDLKATDVEQWLSLTKWSVSHTLPQSVIEHVLEALTRLGLIQNKRSITDYIFSKERLV